MQPDDRYWKNEADFRPIAQAALSSCFKKPAEFDAFYEALTTPERKNKLLRSACFYYYLVQKGDWIVDAPDCDPLIDYLTNSYKVVGIFALIESLSTETYQEFYAWLLEQNPAEVFPIANKEKLEELHIKYKSTFGSIQRSVKFFERLSKERQRELCNAIRTDDKPMDSIKKLAQTLYHMRSEFVHEATLVLQLSGSWAVNKRNKNIRTDLDISLLMRAFEEGVVAYFREV